MGWNVKEGKKTYEWWGEETQNGLGYLCLVNHCEERRLIWFLSNSQRRYRGV